MMNPTLAENLRHLVAVSAAARADVTKNANYTYRPTMGRVPTMAPMPDSAWVARTIRVERLFAHQNGGK